jgi:hypothetical protein
MTTIAEAFRAGKAECLVCGATGDANVVHSEGVRYHDITWRLGRRKWYERWEWASAPSSCNLCHGGSHAKHHRPRRRPGPFWLRGH